MSSDNQTNIDLLAMTLSRAVIAEGVCSVGDRGGSIVRQQHTYSREQIDQVVDDAIEMVMDADGE